MLNRKTRFISFLFRKRRLIQILSLLFIITIPILNYFKETFVIGNYYSLRIWKIDFVDPLFALQHLLLTFKFPVTLLIGILIPLLAAFFAGKMFCSFLCPYNLFAEWLQKFIPRAQIVFNAHARRYWAILLGWLIITVLAGFPILYFVSMPGQISVFISDLIFLKVLGYESLIILVLLFLDVIVFKRIWCRELCPVGAFLERFHYKKGLHINYSEIDCICSTDETDSPCVAQCPLYLNPKSNFVYPSCYNCGACVQECYFYGEALSFKIFKLNTQIIPILENRKENENKEE